MIIELNKIKDSGLYIDEYVSLDKELFSKAKILDLNNIHIIGNIKYDYEDNLVLNLKIAGEFILEDAITLDPINYPFTTNLEETIAKTSDIWQKSYEKSKNTLDIREILWENIVLEIPISVTLHTESDIKTKGNGWELASEKENSIDPRLAKLNDLFKEGKE